ncbi:MAG: N-acetyltransferase family protein [Gloeocapsa sp. DLM2.Bin57]|nr:MAG: N-acetyltransferase family protein [Gloeocapsa sp. DLM2.Bin57]
MFKQIREATELDLPVIVEIYNASIPDRLATADLVPVTLESRLHWFQVHKSGDRPIWVLEIDGKIAGWLSFQSFYGRPAYRHTAEISIYVSPDWRRQGVGQELLTKAIMESPKLNITTLLAFVFAHNQPSLTLFKKQGFQQWGYLPGVAKLDAQIRDLVILGRKV